MSKSDWALVALNALAVMMAMVGLASQHPEPMSIALVLGVIAMVAGSATLIRRGAGDAPARRSRRRSDARDDEMDPRTVLDIDARLEALERREREWDEAARIQQLAARGQQSAPAEPLAEDGSAAPRRERV